jgi:hypothetical protein
LGVEEQMEVAVDGGGQVERVRQAGIVGIKQQWGQAQPVKADPAVGQEQCKPMYSWGPILGGKNWLGVSSSSSSQLQYSTKSLKYDYI